MRGGKWRGNVPDEGVVDVRYRVGRNLGGRAALVDVPRRIVDCVDWRHGGGGYSLIGTGHTDLV